MPGLLSSMSTTCAGLGASILPGFSFPDSQADMIGECVGDFPIKTLPANLSTNLPARTQKKKGAAGNCPYNPHFTPKSAEMRVRVWKGK